MDWSFDWNSHSHSHHNRGVGVASSRHSIPCRRLTGLPRPPPPALTTAFGLATGWLLWALHLTTGVPASDHCTNAFGTSERGYGCIDILWVYGSNVRWICYLVIDILYSICNMNISTFYFTMFESVLQNTLFYTFAVSSFDVLTCCVVRHTWTARPVLVDRIVWILYQFNSIWILYIYKS